jgi:hypothetical protein
VVFFNYDVNQTDGIQEQTQGRGNKAGLLETSVMMGTDFDTLLGFLASSVNQQEGCCSLSGQQNISAPS